MNFKFTADTQTYPSKPSKTEAARISNELKPVYIDTIEGFMEDIQQGIS